MTFVYPILLGGLLLAGLPVLLHFLIRQQPKTLLFPAFRFLVQKQSTNTRKLRLRHFLLLLLRIALIVLLCLALARPRLVHDQFGISRERPVALVLVFDTSPSMDYKHNETTRLDLAKKRCLELLDQLPDECRIRVIDSAEPAAREEWFTSLDKARQRINRLTTRPSALSVMEAIDKSLDLLEEYPKQDDPAAQNYPRFLCVFSDRTKACWDRNRASVVQQKLARESLVKLQTLFIDVGIDEPIDLAILQADLPRTLGGDARQTFALGEQIPLRVVVKGTGKDLASTVLCQVGEHKVQQAFDLKAGKEQSLTLLLDTGAWKLTPGFHQAEVKLDIGTDALSFNNQRFVTFKIHDKQSILVLTDDMKRSWRLPWALETLNYVVDVRSVSAKLDYKSFEKYDAIFLLSVKAPSDPLWQALSAYTRNGGGVAIMPPGDELQHKAYNSDAAQKLLPCCLGDNKVISKEGSEWELDERQHPFLLPYEKWETINPKIDFIAFPRKAWFFWDVQQPLQPNSSVLVSYNSKLDLLRPAVVERKSAGKVLLFTTTMDQRLPEWNNYQDTKTSFYLVTTYLCARYLCKEAANPTLNWQTPPGPRPVLQQTAVFPKNLLSGPDFAEEIRFDKDVWISDRLLRAGNYTLDGAGADKQKLKVLERFSINVPAEESDLQRVAVDEIEAVLGKQSVISQDRAGSLMESLEPFWSEPMELFPWLMILLLFLLAVENLLANRFYRQTSAETT